MKYIFVIIYYCSLLKTGIAQTISPSSSNEYCPGVEYTFTVTIPKAYSNMIGESGCYVTQMPTAPVGTTFTFKGKFGDVNTKQTFRVNHPDNSSTYLNSKGSNLCSSVPVHKYNLFPLQ